MMEPLMKDIRASRRTAPGPARMLIVYRSIDELIPDPANPRRHSRKQIRQIASSIEVFGFNVPILIDRHGKVICGHGRDVPPVNSRSHTICR
jgi:hypothetical protein